MKWKLGKPSPALVIACAALFVALGPAAYASHELIFSSDIVNGEVKTEDLANSAVTNTKLANNTVGTFKIVNGQVGSADLQDGGIVSVDIAAGGVAAGDLAANSINSGKVLDGSLTGADVADESLAGADVLNQTLSGDDVGKAPPFGSLGLDGDQHITDNTITTFDIASNAIDSDEVLDFGLSNQDIGVLFAQLNADGTVANSSGGVSTIKLGTGTYEVDFGRNIAACAYFATQGEDTPGGAGGAIMGATDRSGNVEGVFATTRNADGTLVDREFQLLVVC